MSTKRKNKKGTLANLIKQVDANKIPTSLSSKERSLLFKRHCDDAVEGFGVSAKATSVADLLGRFQSAAKKAEVYAQTLIDAEATIVGWGPEGYEIEVRGFKKMTDAQLIAAFVKDRKAERAQLKQQALTDREAAKRIVECFKRQGLIDG